jgi:hypothetical protein
MQSGLSRFRPLDQSQVCHLREFELRRCAFVRSEQNCFEGE